MFKISRKGKLFLVSFCCCCCQLLWYLDPDCSLCITDFYQNKNFSSKKLIQAGRNKISVGDRPKAIMPEAGLKKAIAVVKCHCEIHWLTQRNENPDSQWPHGLSWQFRTCAIHLWHSPFLSGFLICEKTLIDRQKTKQNNKECMKV